MNVFYFYSNIAVYSASVYFALKVPVYISHGCHHFFLNPPLPSLPSFLFLHPYVPSKPQIPQDFYGAVYDPSSISLRPTERRQDIVRLQLKI